MMEHLVPVFHTTSIPIDGSCLEEEEQPKRERAQKAQDHYRELLGDYYPKLTSLKLNPNAKSKTIMYFDVGIECHNEKLFLGAAESDIVEGISKVLEKFYGARPFDEGTISIRPYIHPTSRTTAALSSGGVAMQEGEYLSNRVARCPITTLLNGQFRGNPGPIEMGYAGFCK